MSFFDNLFNGASNAAQDQIAGIQAGLNAYGQDQASANQAIYYYGDTARQQAMPNYNAANTGVAALGDLLGLNGAAGSQNAQANLATMPGYQAAQGAGADAVNASAAKSGTLNSGNAALALQQNASKLAGQNYQNYVSDLSPYLGFSTAATSALNAPTLFQGSGISQNEMALANTNLQGNAAIGAANANADLANQKSDMGLLGNLSNFITGGGIGQLAGGIGDLGMMLSDERLKENIEPVGELFDGQKVYRYNYLWDDVPRIGVMAQEVEKTNPDAVGEFGGFKAVNYGKATDYAAELGRFLEAA
jgi:hypothetical protein